MKSSPLNGEPTRMHPDKAKTALSTALKHLEESMKALSNGDNEKAASDLFWSASAETEYALFLLSLAEGERTENAPWKHASSSKQSVEIKPSLASAYELLKTALADVEAGNTEKSYEETWKARNLLLKAQELLEKKRKGAIK